MLDVTIDDIRLSEYGFCLTERPSIPVADEDVTFHSGIDGRDGGLVERGGLKDRPLKLTVNILEDVPAKPIIRIFRGKLLSKRLSQLIFSDEPDIYYVIKHIKVGNIDNEITEKGEFDLDLTLDPFDYKKTIKAAEGTNSLSVINEGTYPALPVLTVTGVGNVVIKTNDAYTVSITDLNGSLVIDSELLDYFDPNKPLVRAFKIHTKAFPELRVGVNRITTTGTVTKLKIEFKERYR